MNPGQGRILRSRILVSTSEKPFVRAGKGTIVRKLTESLYQKEIDFLYSEPVVKLGLSLPVLRPTFDLPAVLQYVRTIVAALLPSAEQLKNDDDLFANGLDSLKMLEMVGTLKAALALQTKSELGWLSSQTIYEHPTISQLGRMVVNFLNSKKIPERPSQDITVRMEKLIEKLTLGLGDRIAMKTPQKTTGLVIAIIGATGFLGTAVLEALLQEDRISHIWCLVRGSGKTEEQLTALRGKGCSSHQLAKLAYRVVNLGDVRLDLSESEYFELQENVDIFLHNAWKLDFNLSLESFEDLYLRSVRHLLEFAISGTKHHRIVFVSSVSSVMFNSGGPSSSALIPSSPISNLAASFPIGYATSKLVAERVLALASQKFDIPTTVLRVAQIGGPKIKNNSSKGPIWPKQEWLYNLIRTSKAIGAIPADVALIDWLSIEDVAAYIATAITKPASTEMPLQVENIVNPQPQP